MLHWIAQGLLLLVVCGLLGLGGYGTLYFYRATVAADAQVARLSNERAADIAAAGAHARTCAAAVSAATMAGVRIGRIASPRAHVAGAPQPMVTADQIAQAIQ